MRAWYRVTVFIKPVMLVKDCDTVVTQPTQRPVSRLQILNCASNLNTQAKKPACVAHT